MQVSLYGHKWTKWASEKFSDFAEIIQFAIAGSIAGTHISHLQCVWLHWCSQLVFRSLDGIHVYPWCTHGTFTEYPWSSCVALLSWAFCSISSTPTPITILVSLGVYRALHLPEHCVRWARRCHCPHFGNIVPTRQRLRFVEPASQGVRIACRFSVIPVLASDHFLTNRTDPNLLRLPLILG